MSCREHTQKVDLKEAGIYKEDYWRHLDYLLQLKEDVASITSMFEGYQVTKDNDLYDLYNTAIITS
ncbi:hypothetical protein [Robiginitalea sp. IMCC43444]|uniref:hypothetical protein n=1 Tax=Robiginitalea sp. IMCC43444 TaxID=3459121 RepID=UPI004042548B